MSLTVHHTEVHPALVCPKCAHKIGTNALHVESEAIELRCIACHTTVAKAEIEIPEWDWGGR
jgi:hypothetical protein